jgi:hypothetical protein
VRLHELCHHLWNIHSLNRVRFLGDLADCKTASRSLQLVEHLLFIVVRAKYLRHDVQLMVIVLGGLGQLRTLNLFPDRIAGVSRSQPLASS